MGKLKVGVLGATGEIGMHTRRSASGLTLRSPPFSTGTVGQRFILQLADHPQFELSALGASSSSTGKSYKEAVAGRWKQVKPIPQNVEDIRLVECAPEGFAQCEVVFSGLDSGPASTIGGSRCLALFCSVC